MLAKTPIEAIVYLLGELHGDPNASACNTSPLSSAVQAGHGEVVRALCQLGADPSISTGSMALSMIAECAGGIKQSLLY